MAQKWVLTALGPSGPTNFDSPPHFTPTIGGPDPLGAFAPTQMAKKGQKPPKWLKMTKNSPKSGSRRHLGPRDPPTLTPTPFYPNCRWSGPTRSHCPPPKWPKRVKKGLKGPKMAQNDPKRGSRRHLGPLDPPILTPHPILPQLQGVRTHLEPLPLTQMAKKGQKKRPKRDKNGSKWPKMAPK